ncbi:MAG TPA: CoA transferase, partial [Spirochaetia bacterium]|nr:CoA transferase [Spirochaetia bacterium]
YQRESTGVGQKIDVAMLDCQVAILENALARYQVAGVPPQPLGNRHPTITPFQAYKAADDYIVVAMGNDNLWRAFTTAVERPELATDPRFATNQGRTENIDALNEIMEPLFAERTVDQWNELLETAKIPHSRINTIDKVMSHPQVLARNMVVDVDDPIAGRVKIAGNPIKMSGFQDETTRPRVPELGEHTEEVLSSLGFTTEEIAALQADGAV